MSCPQQTKIRLLHTQVAMLTASVATLQTQVQALETIIGSMVLSDESSDSSDNEQSMADGYDTDSAPLSGIRRRVRTRAPKRSSRGSSSGNKFVMISSKVEDTHYDSGYESSD